VQTFVFILTKNNPIRRRYELTRDLLELEFEEKIPDFIPYSRLLYVCAGEEVEAQRKVFDYMREHGLADWKDIPEGLCID
jgi:hypothetical protein